MEELYLINDLFFRELVDELLAEEGTNNLSWLILTVEHLEALQPYLATGIKFSGIVQKLQKELQATTSYAIAHEAIHGIFATLFNETVKGLHEQTGRTYKDSFLYQRELHLYRLLGLPDEPIEDS